MIDATGSGEDTYYYHRNRRFSIIGLTDSSGSVIERYSYTAYGEVTVLDANAAADADGISDVINSYTYTGRRLDDETGLLYFRARYHDPVLGRFLERDPLGYPDGLNTYAAYHVMRGTVDPYGLDTEEDLAYIDMEQDFKKWTSELEASTTLFTSAQHSEVEKKYGKIMLDAAQAHFTANSILASMRVGWTLTKEVAGLHPALKGLIMAVDVGLAATDGEEEFLDKVAEIGVNRLLKRPKAAIDQIFIDAGVEEAHEIGKLIKDSLGHVASPNTISRSGSYSARQHAKDSSKSPSKRDCLRDWYSLSVSFNNQRADRWKLTMNGEYCHKKCCYGCQLHIAGYPKFARVVCVPNGAKCK